MKGLFKFSTYFLFVIYLTSYVVFESWDLPSKIDTHVHLIRVMNLLNSFKDGSLFPDWHSSPYWGYPEDFNFILAYLVSAFFGLFLPIAISFKLTFFSFYLLAAYTSEWGLKQIFKDNRIAFLGSLLYLGSASFLNFGPGSGSTPRVAAMALFPILIGAFIKWWEKPEVKSTAGFCLIFLFTYMAHPVAAMAGMIAMLFVLPFFQSPIGLKERLLKNKWYLLSGVLVFAWYFGNILYAKKLSSWDDVYGHYANYRLHFYFKSFFAFWSNEEQRTLLFYMGSLPLISTLIGTVYLWKKKILTNSFLYSLCLTLIGMSIVLFGQDIIQRNTYRFDLIFNFGIAGAFAYLLNNLKWKKLSFAFLAMILIEQTWFFRSFGGRDYIGTDRVNEFKTQHQQPLKAPRVLFDHLHPHLVMTEIQLNRLSTSYWLDFHGILEITPYNLGFIPYGGFESSQMEKIYQFFGMPRYNDNRGMGVATVYSKYLIIEATSRKASFDKVYRELLKDGRFNPQSMPLIFHKSFEEKTIVRSPDLKFSQEVGAEADWKAAVVKYFEDSHSREVETFNVSVQKNELLIIKEAFHPRRSLMLNSHELEMQVAEPGLVAVTPRDNLVGRLELISDFTLLEKILGLISLLAFLTLVFLFIFGRKYVYNGSHERP